MRNLLLFGGVILIGASCTTECEDRHQGPLATAVTNVVLRLDQARFQPVRQGWDFDYGFQEGTGLLNTYEYVRSLCSYEALQSALPMRIFERGPHSKDSLDLTNPYDFGRYNPEFVELFRATAGNLLESEAFIAASRDGMRKHGLLEKLERLREMHGYIEANTEEFDRFKKEFEAAIAGKTWGKDDYRTRLPKALDSEAYWNWSETAYYFWVRREVDGTRGIWIHLINDILRAYKAPPAK